MNDSTTKPLCEAPTERQVKTGTCTPGSRQVTRRLAKAYGKFVAAPSTAKKAPKMPCTTMLWTHALGQPSASSEPCRRLAFIGR
jgi:hypothetical protein